MKRITLRQTLLCGTSLALLAGTAQGAVIASWGSLQAISSNADIINPGGVLQAINIGSDSADINVTTSAGTIVFKQGGFGGKVFAGDGFFVDNNTDDGAATVTGDNSSDFHRVLDSFRDNGASGATFSGLADGTYNVQMFFSDDRGSKSDQQFLIIEDFGGFNEVIRADTGFFDRNDAIFRSGYYTGTVQLTNNTGGFTVVDRSANGRVLNAVVLSQAGPIPEPGSLALLAVGGACMLRRRRK